MNSDEFRPFGELQPYPYKTGSLGRLTQDLDEKMNLFFFFFLESLNRMEAKILPLKSPAEVNQSSVF